jgi:hypothetical protein
MTATTTMPMPPIRGVGRVCELRGVIGSYIPRRMSVRRTISTIAREAAIATTKAGTETATIVIAPSLAQPLLPLVQSLPQRLAQWRRVHVREVRAEDRGLLRVRQRLVRVTVFQLDHAHRVIRLRPLLQRERAPVALQRRIVTIGRGLQRREQEVQLPVGGRLRDAALQPRLREPRGVLPLKVRRNRFESIDQLLRDPLLPIAPDLRPFPSGHSTSAAAITTNASVVLMARMFTHAKQSAAMKVAVELTAVSSSGNCPNATAANPAAAGNENVRTKRARSSSGSAEPSWRLAVGGWRRLRSYGRNVTRAMAMRNTMNSA